MFPLGRFATVFAVLNVLMVYLFLPSMGLDFGERSVIWQGIGATL